MSTLSVEAVTQAVHNLPVMPPVLAEILHSLDDDSLSGDVLAAKIRHDQTLVAKTLKLANSSFFGVSREVASIEDAVVILGLRTVRSMVIASSIAGSFNSQANPGFDFIAFWRHSLATALCAQSIANETGHPSDLAFLQGLLHDLGRLALAVQFPEAYTQVASYRSAHDGTAYHAELAVLGIDHAEIGANLAEHWLFPPAIVAAIAAHHEPDEEAITPAAIVYLADNIVHALDLVGDPLEVVPPLNLLVWQSFGLTDEQCLRIFQHTESKLDDICACLFP